LEDRFMKFGRTLLIAASILAIATPAIASNGGGSGGGGSAPSASGSGIDPAKRYAEGIEYLKAANYKQAEKAFGSVLDVAGRDANTNYMMALAQIGQSDFKNARKFLRNAVKYDANHAHARGWLGAVEAKLGDAAKASEQRSALAAMKDKCAATCAEAAIIDASLARIDTQMAAPDTPMVLSGDPVRFASAKDGDASYLKASALINEGRYEDALYSLRAAGVALGPHPDVLTYQGFANRKLGRFDLAVSYYSAALKLQPDHRGANEYLGEYYVEVGDLSKARAQLKTLDGICKFGCEEAEELRRWIAGEKS
jgi:tetratricopeptide (TPR) repeat protein